MSWCPPRVNIADMERFVILLRGVNVGGRMLPMAGLKAAVVAAGFVDCTTYIQSGNLLLSSPGLATEVERAIEAVIEASFGMAVVAIARTAADLAACAATNPFPDAAPKMLHLCLAKRPLAADTADLLTRRCAAGERVAVVGQALWIDFNEGVGRSALSPAAIDKAAGSTVTARNWTTIGKLIELTAA